MHSLGWLTALPPHSLSQEIEGYHCPHLTADLHGKHLTSAFCQGDSPGCGCLKAPHGRGGRSRVSAKRASTLASECHVLSSLPGPLRIMSGVLALHEAGSGPPSQPSAQGWWIGYLLDRSLEVAGPTGVRREQQCLPSAGVRAFSSQCLLSFYCLI